MAVCVYPRTFPPLSPEWLYVIFERKDIDSRRATAKNKGAGWYWGKFGEKFSLYSLFFSPRPDAMSHSLILSIWYPRGKIGLLYIRVYFLFKWKKLTCSQLTFRFQCFLQFAICSIQHSRLLSISFPVPSAPTAPARTPHPHSPSTVFNEYTTARHLSVKMSI